MDFCAPIFPFAFLPLLLVLHAACPRGGRNLLLLLASLLFYFWGGRQHLLLLVALAAAHWWLGRWVAAGGRKRLAAAVGIDLAVLAACKYAGFVVGQLAPLCAALGLPEPPRPTWHLPLGISFFVFEAIAYLIDIHRRQSTPADSPTHLGLYLTYFPHLFAGPIVRYREIAGQFTSRTITEAGFADGIRRVIIGLAKKALLANPMALTVEAIFAVPPGQLSAGAAWLGLVAYALQLYFDFSGYSDLAVGLAKLFGFTLPENFDRPYTAQTVGEFWRRWHITLSSWLRDYVYLPLGGSRRGRLRTACNLLAVFLLCGLWHGAGWTFIVWGLWHGLFVALEHLGFAGLLARAGRPVRHAYTLAVVLVGWAFFRAADLPHAFGYLQALAGTADGVFLLGDFWDRQLALALAAGVAVCAWPASRVAALLVLFAAVAVELVAGTYNPFIYGRF